MKDSIKKVGIIGSGLDRGVSLNLLKEPKSIHIKTKDELTNENVKHWVEDGVTVVIIDSDGTRLESPSLHIMDKPFIITHCDYTYVDEDILVHGKQEKKQRKEHYRAVQNKHSFKNNYKPYIK